MIYLVAQIALFLLAALLLGLVLGWLVWGRLAPPSAETVSGAEAERLLADADLRLTEANARISELEAALAAERAADGSTAERAV